MTVAVAHLFPDLLGTYGDAGNAAILAARLRWRGIEAEVVTVRSGHPVPDGCQIYVVGGGEDLPQAQAAVQLGAGRSDSPLARAVSGGAVVLAVCAGMQILGRSFTGPDGAEAEGLGLLDCITVPGTGPRMVGELVIDADPELKLPLLTGYENHAGATSLGPGARPLGRVRTGSGNGPGSGVDGALAGRVLGTYMHGPVLARNPALADLLLTWAVGSLEHLDDSECDDLRRERLGSVLAGASRRRWSRSARR
jgi:lipid II isoglutaminyl synthase (glutamine-hydrolysing)